MNKYVMSLPFRLCRLKIKGRNIGYCKNQGLIDAITFIGEYRAPYEKIKAHINEELPSYVMHMKDLIKNGLVKQK